jgi:hypothetical protein
VKAIGYQFESPLIYLSSASNAIAGDIAENGMRELFF